MTTRVGIYDGGAIVVYDETQPEREVVVGTVVDAARLIAALTALASQHQGEDAWRQAEMRVLVEAAAAEDWPPD